MTPLTILCAGAAAFAVLTTAPAAAQFVQAPTPTADALAAQMRQLGANPRDVYALIAAGELSTKLGDPAAALGFFGRAQAIAPTNPRIAAGKAGALVLLERPGEALRLYDQAERGGVSMTPYLAQRGLAYDLIGQPGYAQRDYRRALLTAPDDETVRRLALSLGISGHRDEALVLLDPLLRRSDRGAWRARACILAVTGDVPGAQRIAASMMSGGAALSPFFGRLQSLSPADRAFAVHFGEISPTVARSNDARLAPALAALPAEPQALPAPAPVVASDTREPARRDTRRARPGRQPVTLAAATPSPTPAPAPTLPAPVTQLAMRDPAPTAIPDTIQRAAAPGLATPWAMTADAQRPPVATSPSPRSAAPAIEIVTLPPRRRVQPAAVPTPAPAPTPTPTPTDPPSTASAAAIEPVAAAPAPTTAAPAPPRPAPETRTPEVARRNTAMLASIIETIAVPSSELAPAPKPRPATRKPPEPKPEATVADTKKADRKKPEPKKSDPAKAEPERWWVQVAGGANAADLGKDWKRLTAKSPTAFRGRTAWTTPLRATNRLLAGPFKSQAEAATFVNTLAKEGTSAFAWQSEAGQKVDRLSAK